MGRGVGGRGGGGSSGGGRSGGGSSGGSRSGGSSRSSGGSSGSSRSVGSSRSGGGSSGGSRSGGGRSGGSFNNSRGSSPSSGSFNRPSGGSPYSSGGGSLFSGNSNKPSGGGSFGGKFMGSYLGNKMGSGPSGGGYNYPPSGGSSSRRGCGCSSVLMILLVIGIVLIILFALSSKGTEFTKSTIVREPLPKGSVNETEYYTDELMWIENKTAFTAGLKYFYGKTGVQPYIYLTDTINGSNYPSPSDLENFANTLYDELFTDEAHVLLVFFEYSSGDYMDYYVTGTQAKAVIDREAGDILLDFIDKNYYDFALSEDEMFSNSFRDAADRIMDVTKSPWINVFIVLGIIMIFAFLFVWWKRAKKQKNMEAQQMQTILNTPIEKFGETEIKNLEEKYDNENSNSNPNQPDF